MLVGALGKEGITPGSDIIVNERNSGNMLNQQIEVPTLSGDPTSILQKIHPAPDAGPLTFRTVGIGKRLAGVLKPRWLRIGGYWHPRGGIPIDVFWQTGKLPAGVWLPDQGMPTYRARG